MACASTWAPTSRLSGVAHEATDRIEKTSAMPSITTLCCSRSRFFSRRPLASDDATRAGSDERASSGHRRPGRPPSPRLEDDRRLDHVARGAAEACVDHAFGVSVAGPAAAAFADQVRPTFRCWCRHRARRGVRSWPLLDGSAGIVALPSTVTHGPSGGFRVQPVTGLVSRQEPRRDPSWVCHDGG